jgi:hypothetical protein
MKTLFLLLLLINTLFAYSQTTIPIKFKVTEEAEAQIGKEWDFSYTPLHTPINITFDGKTLKMVYETGKVYYQTSVLSYEYKDIIDKTLPRKEYSILKISRDGFIQYIIITYTHSVSETDNYYTLSQPFVTKTGDVFSYRYFQ